MRENSYMQVLYIFFCLIQHEYFHHDVPLDGANVLLNEERDREKKGIRRDMNYYIFFRVVYDFFPQVFTLSFAFFSSQNIVLPPVFAATMVFATYALSTTTQIILLAMYTHRWYAYKLQNCFLYEK